MTSIFKQVKENLESKCYWNFYSTCFHASIIKEEKGYVGKVVLADVPFQAKSNDLFELWGIMGEFLDVKAMHLEYAARGAAHFSSMKHYRGCDTPVVLDESFKLDALKLMQ